MRKQIGIVLMSSFLIQAVSSAYYPAQAPTISLDEATAPLRITQAKEIFGRRSSKASLVRTTIFKANLAQFVIAKLDEELPPEYKSQSQEIAATLISSSTIHSLDPLLVLATIKQESKFHPDALGRHGEIGLMQIKPDTAQWIAARAGLKWKEDSSLFDPQLNIRIGTAYLSFLRASFNHRGRQYLAAYNSGPAFLHSKLRNNESLPSEYVTALIGHYAELYQSWLKFDAALVAKLD